MNKKTIEKMKQRLIQRRNELYDEINRFTEPDSTGMDGENLGDVLDEATRDMEVETAWMVTEMESKELKEVEEALAKLKKGKYGICEACKKPIKYRRLNALPFAKFCIDCQRRKEEYSSNLVHSN